MKTKIAVTGGIGSGKSTFLEYVRKAGYPTFSCDEIYKEVVRSKAYIEKLTKEFPSCVEGGQVNKAKLATIVFQNEAKRLALNAIAHPMITSSLFERMENCKGDLVFAEVPLLFEGNYQNGFDRVIVLLRDENARVSSVIHRDGLLEREVQDRIAAQFDYHSDEAKKIFKDCNAILIENNQNEEALQEKIEEIISKLR